MFKNIKKNTLGTLLCIATLSSALEAAGAVPAQPGPYVGVTPINNSTVKLNFLDNSDDEDGFHVYLDGALVATTVPANDANATPQVLVDLMGLSCTETHSVYAVAYNTDGVSLPTDTRHFNFQSTFGITCPTAPDAPGSYIGVTGIDNSSATINFLDNSTNETGFYVYLNNVLVTTLGDNDEMVTPNVSTALTGLNCDETYEVYATAFNGGGESAKSDTRTFNLHTTFGMICPTIPNAPGSYIGVTAIDESSVTVNFADNSDNETGFKLYMDGTEVATVGENNESSTPNVSIDLTGLTCDQTYSLYAVAFNGVGTSASSDTRTFNIHTTFGLTCPLPVTIPAAPGPYLGVTAMDNSSVRIDFVDNSDNEDSFCLVVDGNVTAFTSGANNELVTPTAHIDLTGLTCDQIYTVSVVAKNGAGSSAPSDDRTFNIHTTFALPCGGA